MAMSTLGNPLIPNTPKYTLSKLLSANTAEAFTVPTDAKWVVFKGTGDFYANYSTTAAVPGDITDGTASELNPDKRNIAGVSSISIISAATPIVTASFYV